MESFLLYLSLALVVLWTVRIARSKGRSLWLWGGASLALWFIPSWPSLLGMVPMVILLFLRPPQTRTEARPEGVTCPRCHTAQSGEQRYCTRCGWELRQPHVEDSAKREENTSTPAVSNSIGRITATTNRAAAETAETASQSADENRPAQESPAQDEAVAQGPPAEPAPSAVEWVFTRPPTAQGMTERGLALLREGRFQRAIDQFTKAIALDPGYKEAWARRAEAYERLGREKEAAEDLRHLEAIESQS